MSTFRQVNQTRVLMLLLAVLTVAMLVLLTEKHHCLTNNLIQERLYKLGRYGSGSTSSCSSSRAKRILMWTSFWGNYSEQWEKIFYRMVSRQCPVSNCEIVYDHRNLDTADAVLLHLIDVLNTTSLPVRRSTEQVWVMFSLEAPPVVDMFPVDFSRLSGTINWTMTYRRDSDIVTPYGLVKPTDHHEIYDQIESPLSKIIPSLFTSRPQRDYWAEKSPDRKVAWMVSHCATDGRREWFVKTLAKHIKVDVYGRCGNKKCGKNISIKTLGTFNQDVCNQEINTFYFYLAFENSICEDYVTEKFFMALQLDVVPVVFGGADYSAIAPPHSYINALEFQTPRQLAEVLEKVAADRTLYNRFFEWKERYTVELGHPFLPMVCDLCARLHGASADVGTVSKSPPGAIEGLQSHTSGRDGSGSYPDLQGWFVTGSSCRRWWADQEDYRKHAPVEKSMKKQ